jgi:hypothetical protein
MNRSYAPDLVPTLCVGTGNHKLSFLKKLSLFLSGYGRGASELHSHAERGNETNCVTPNEYSLLYSCFSRFIICVNSWLKKSLFSAYSLFHVILLKKC